MNLGEGAGYLVLSSKPEGAICEITGWGNVDEAFHQTGSSPDGDGPYMAMTKALAVAGLSPSDIDAINPHGTATIGNDQAEMAAFRRIWSDEIPPFKAVKALIGHTLAASEGIEAVYCAAALSGMLKGKGWGDNPRHILSNAFGFAGNQTSLIFSAL